MDRRIFITKTEITTSSPTLKGGGFLAFCPFKEGITE